MAFNKLCAAMMRFDAGLESTALQIQVFEPRGACQGARCEYVHAMKKAVVFCNKNLRQEEVRQDDLIDAAVLINLPRRNLPAVGADALVARIARAMLANGLSLLASSGWRLRDVESNLIFTENPRCPHY